MVVVKRTYVASRARVPSSSRNLATTGLRRIVIASSNRLAES